jgi:thiosulfate/3-mercaptopyruvate sulfurtransferase
MQWHAGVQTPHSAREIIPMPSTPATWLVETDWLASHLTSPDVVVLDGSMHLPTSGRDAKAEYAGAHIPGAIYFDIDAVSDKANPLPHMLPSSFQFASQMKKLGIGDGHQIIVYDSEGLYSAARVWWMFRIMGNQNVRVLNGGFKKWRTEGRVIEDMPPIKRTERHFTARFNGALVRSADEVKALIGHAQTQIVDARAAPRFAGSVPEPRAGLRAGHIPSSKSLPFGTLLNADGTLKPRADLAQIIAAAKVDVQRPVVASCGSGVTAGVVALALAELGHADTAVYDGSWTEWGARTDLPIATGSD